MNPILVTGADRSGTTLMYVLLASHPAVSMVRRTNMFRWFHGRFGDLSYHENLDACMAEMLAYRRMAILHPDSDRIRREFLQGSTSYGRLFSLFHDHEAERVGKPRWGDKSLHTEYHAAAVFSEFPQARMIHVVRDPRDRHASVTNRYQDTSKGIAAITGRWIASARIGRTNLGRYPDRYLVVRYEDLARRPEETLAEVCRFIGEPYDPAMLAMDGAPDDSDQSGNSSFGAIPTRTISTGSIGRYREILSRSELAFIQTTTRRHLAWHHYDHEPIPMALTERMAFWVKYYPIQFSGLEAWITADTLRRRRGVKPPTSRMISMPVEQT